VTWRGACRVAVASRRGWNGAGWRRRGWGRDVAREACCVEVVSRRVDGRESWRSRGLARGEIATALVGCTPAWWWRGAVGVARVGVAVVGPGS
jgi:hypothetical protein